MTDRHPIAGLRDGNAPAAAPTQHGQTDGWWWATDTYTVCGIKDGDPDDETQAPNAARAVEILAGDFPTPVWAALPTNLDKLGGVGRLRTWGTWDLDRVSAATDWIDNDEGRYLLLAVDEGPMLRIAGPSGRVACVMGIRADADRWFPRIWLPVENPQHLMQGGDES